MAETVVTTPKYHELQPDEAPISYEEFLLERDGGFAEWVDGKVLTMSPVSVPHQELSLFLSRIMAEFVEDRDLGHILTAPFQMRLRNVRRGREPDIMYVAAPNVDRLTHTYLDGAADLVVEIVSPESMLRDRGEKYAEYELEGVREYWIIDPDQQRADFFGLSAESRYERRHPDSDSVYRSEVLPNFRLRVDWLWQRPLPKLRAILAEIESL